jgi:curved DNA-binding protein CbpA
MDVLDFYRLLGVAETADSESIKKAIREQRRTWNKRAGQSDPTRRAQAEERIRQIAEAERVLLDPHRREAFDRQVKPAWDAAPHGPAASSGTRDWMAAAREYAASGNAASALYAAREAISHDGASHEAWSIRANSSFVLGNFQDAEFEFKEAIRLQPDNPEYHFDLAEAYTGRHEWKSALDEYEMSLRLAPGNPVYRTAIANVYIQNAVPERALALMDAVVKEHPNVAVFQYYLALALHDTNLAKWTKLRNGKFLITSPAQIAVTRDMSGRALGLRFDDPPLRASLEDNLRFADQAEAMTWFHSQLGGYALTVVVGLIILAFSPIVGILVVAGAVALYVATHRMPRWKHQAKLPAPMIAKRGI